MGETMNFMKFAAPLFGLCISTSLLAADAPAGTGEFGAFAASKDWTPPNDPAVLKKLAEWQDQKLGLLISWQACTQWGIDSWPLCTKRYPWNKRFDFVHNVEIPGASDDRAYKKAHENLIATFNPVKFDPAKWAEAAKDGGVKYVLVMSKHMDGFNMYGTKFSDYGITSPRYPFSTNANADVLKAQVDAFRSQGIRVGMYVSKADLSHTNYWSSDHPLFNVEANYDTRKHPDRWAAYKNFFWNQMEELVTGYGPLDILWLDDGWVKARRENLDITGMAAMARKYQPGLIVVDRTVRGRNENYITPEGDHAMPPGFLPYPWEVCQTMGTHWNYFPNDQFKSTGALIRNLCCIVARGGNYLIGIGPDATGEFDPPVYARLKEMGAWLKLNGEDIYGTRPVKPYEQAN